MQQHIPTSDAPIPYTPPALANVEREAAAGEPLPVIPSFLVAPVTEAEFDRLGFELFRHNIQPPTTDTFRAKLIDEIFEIFGEEDGEEKAMLMDEYWRSEDVFNQQMADWYVKDEQRRADIAQGAPKRPALPLPDRAMSLRQRNKAMSLADDMKTKSRPVRDMTIEMQTYEPKQRAGLTRLTLLGWEGLSTPFAIEDGIVPEETYDALRGEIGRLALSQLETFCGTPGITAEERGNLGSPPQTGQTDVSSPTQSGEPVSSDGYSTSEESTIPSTSNSTQTPVDGSDQSTDASSTSISPSTGEVSSIDDTRAAPSPEPHTG